VQKTPLSTVGEEDKGGSQWADGWWWRGGGGVLIIEPAERGRQISLLERRRTSMSSGIITRMPYRVMETCVAIKVKTICMCL
jgi:hypothetical protein